MTFTYIKINECAEFLISSLSLLFACLKYLYYAQSKKFTRNFYRETLWYNFNLKRARCTMTRYTKLKSEKLIYSSMQKKLFSRSSEKTRYPNFFKVNFQQLFTEKRLDTFFIQIENELLFFFNSFIFFLPLFFFLGKISRSNWKDAWNFTLRHISRKKSTKKR